tara:strand:- start:515 stop:1330 length:816 start_codon:yes stop_codon:yes gene_type:complete
MADEIYNRIEKQLEGNSLALSAVAEVLQKMDARMATDEEVALAKQEEEAAAADRQSLIKDIAAEVAGILKADQGMDVSGEERPAKPTGKTPAGADDSETPVAATTNIEDQQNTIQAMSKADEDDEEDMEKGHDEDDDMEKGGMYYKDEEEDEEEIEKEDDDDEEMDEEMKSLAKQVKQLKKALAATESNMHKAIKVESEERLRKMGFKEDNGLQAPQRVSLGLDGTDTIKKSADNIEVVDQLASLSYKELRDMQTSIEAGNTDGIPRELLG